MSKRCPICGWLVCPKKPEVTEEFMEKWWKTFKALQSGKFRGLTIKLIKQMLEEAGVSIA